jgi:hypothetical protein
MKVRAKRFEYTTRFARAAFKVRKRSFLDQMEIENISYISREA